MLPAVDSTKPSWTAEGVAAERAVLAAMGVLRDPFATKVLTPRMAILFRIVRLAPR